MKEELEQQLEHDFPFMQKSRVKEERNTYKIFGCECGDGWYGLIHELCQSITDRYVKEEILPENIDLIPIQIKEKFGILSYYYSFKDMPCKESVDDSKKKLRNDIAYIVHNYQEKSMSICENCGKSGKLRSDLPWEQTLCDQCYEKCPNKLKRKQ